MKETRFVLALLNNGHPALYGGVPLFIPLEPEISYDKYSDHPHLNVGGVGLIPGLGHLAVPDSLCYVEDPAQLGHDPVERLYLASLQERLNPVGMCRCRSGKTYSECHLRDDIRASGSGLPASRVESQVRTKIKTWDAQVGTPLRRTREALRDAAGL